MRELTININDVKNFFCKKERNKDGLITKRILGVTMRYIRAEIYNKWNVLLKYIEPYSEENLQKTIKETMSDFGLKGKKKDVKPKTYEKDKERMQEIINQFDVTKLPPCSGKLRKIQMKELEFTKEIITDIEQNTGLKPFMDDGTLLGAVRHGGFIPWDDDIDFSLMREDYNKLIEYLSNRYIRIDTSNWLNLKGEFAKNLKECFKKYPNQIFCLRRHTSFKCYRGTEDDYTVLDFFALDYYNDMHNVVTLQKYIDDFRDRVRLQVYEYKERFEYCDKEFAESNDLVKDSDVIYAGIDNYDFFYYDPKEIRRKSDIFPLKRMKFEDTEFWAPNNTHMCLKSIYNRYDRLPLDPRIVAHQGCCTDIIWED